MVLVITILLVFIAVSVAMYFYKRHQTIQKVLALHEAECEKLAASRLKFQVLDSKITNYTNSLDDRHHNMIQKVTQTFNKVSEVLDSIDLDTVKNFPVETECMFKILNNQDSEATTRIFDTESDAYQLYNSLRGWDKEVDSNIKFVGKVVLTASRNFKVLKPERNQRNDTVVDFQRAGILDIPSDNNPENDL